MSRPKFKRRVPAYLTWGPTWTAAHRREVAEEAIAQADQREAWQAAAEGLPATRPRMLYVDVDKFADRILSYDLHAAYLRRTGGLVNTRVPEMDLRWNCCGRDELLTDVHYDRHGNLRPEEIALIRARSYYHRCENRQQGNEEAAR